MKLLCFTCGFDVIRPPCHVARTTRVFCSRECHDKAQRRRISKKCKCCGTFFEVRPSESSRFSTCSKRCYRLQKRKENNPNWRGGKTSARKAAMSCRRYINWRKAVFERDNYTCLMCGERGGVLNADHVKPWAYFPALRYSVANGRTLCLTCHKKTYKEVFKWRKLKGG